ncbi:hypothetical protein [Variovorax sp. DXTD-1]|uniref:hypothetical protein n=1 Tax=Variovorax sp. DXTD-1 TaxID=2495592 RepID=UPI00163BB1E1|nr:hypothetical protein [Variovorax sp. DXTD-1]
MKVRIAREEQEVLRDQRRLQDHLAPLLSQILAVIRSAAAAGSSSFIRRLQQKACRGAACEFPDNAGFGWLVFQPAPHGKTTSPTKKFL